LPLPGIEAAGNQKEESYIIGFELLLSASDVLPLELVVDLGEVLHILEPELLIDDVLVSMWQNFFLLIRH
jgi:hypothetical protein